MFYLRIWSSICSIRSFTRRIPAKKVKIKHNAEKAQPELTAVAEMLPGYQVKTQVLLGSAPGVEIVEYAKEAGTDMIIMTRSSRGPIRKLGSVATYIVRNASFLDVIVMREEDD